MVGFISKNYLDVAHIRENTIILYLFRDYLIFYTVMYLNNNTNKIHTIASNVNVWYYMVLHRCAWSPSSDPVRSPSFHRYGAKSMVPSLWSNNDYNMTYCIDHITSQAALQNKVRRFYFYPFACCTWLLGLSSKNCFPTYEHWTIVLKTKPVRWFDQKKPEPKASPVFWESLVQLIKNQKNCIKIICFRKDMIPKPRTLL
jgi:hypothetical protein